MARLFPTGLIRVTPGAVEVMKRTGLTPADLIERHVDGDWGDLDRTDKVANDYALAHGLRIISAYGRPPDRLWVVTEPDRSVTTILTAAEA